MKRMLPIIVLAAAAGAAQAQTAYWVDSNGELVRDGYGNCVRTGSWSESQAIVECDPDLVRAETPRAEPPPPPRPAAPAPRLHQVTLASGTTFAIGSATLNDDGKRELDVLVEQLKAPGTNVTAVTVEGHTDSTGSEALNQRLSEQRAQAVKDYMVEKGVDAELITTVGHGQSKPIADNNTTQGRAQNRRVEINVDGTVRR